MSLHVPLAVRLKTARTDRFITRDLRTLRYGSSIPGGFATLSAEFDRPLRAQPDEVADFADVWVYDARSAAVLWQGRLEDPGRRAGPDGEIWSLRAMGPSARAHDRTVPLIYVDRSLERWKRYHETGNMRHGRTEVTEDSVGDPRLLTGAERGQVWAQDKFVGWAYRAIREAGQKLARIGYTRDGAVTDADFRQQALVRTGTGAGTVVEDDGLNTTSAAESAVVTTDWTAGPDVANLRLLQQNATAQTVADDVHYGIFADVVVTALRLNKAGTELTAASNYGATVLASQVVEDLLGRLLTMYDGANASVAATAFAIEQLAYPDGVTPAKVLDDLMGFHRDHYWAAWEDGTAGKSRFEWRAWPTSVRYEATAADGFDSPGSATDLYDAVRVRWRGTDGRIRSNRRTQTVAALTDAGLTREAIIDLGDDVGTSANADRAGDQFLAEHATAPNAGTLDIRTPIIDRDLGRAVYPWEIRPGHLIRVRDVVPRVDALNPTARDGVTIFRVVSTDYDVGTNTCRLGLDSPARTLAQIVGRRPPSRRR